MPTALFNANLPYVYLYSAFGGHTGTAADGATTGNNNGGFEEWSAFTGTAAITPSLTITKTAALADGSPVAHLTGEVINYTITIHNTGNINLTGVVLTDQVEGQLSTTLSNATVTGDNGNGVLDVGETWVYHTSYTVTLSDLTSNGINGDGFISNVATVTTSQTPAQTATAQVPVGMAAWTVSKAIVSATPSDPQDGTGPLVDHANETVTFQVTVQNTGFAAITGVSVTDSVEGGSPVSVTSLSGDTNHNNVLDVGETWVYTGSYQATQAQIDNNGGGDGQLNDTVSVTSNELGTKTASAAVPIDQDPALTVSKTYTTSPTDPGDAGQVDHNGQVITYSIVVTNSGNETLHNVTVTDPLTGQTVNLGTIAVGGSATLSGSYTATQADIDNNGHVAGSGTIVNTATVSSQEGATGSATVSTPIDQDPALSIAKSGTVADGHADAVGDVVNWAVSVGNAGNVAVSGVNVTDSLAPRYCAGAGRSV